MDDTYIIVVNVYEGGTGFHSFIFCADIWTVSVRPELVPQA